MFLTFLAIILILCFFIAPAMIFANRARLKKMYEISENFHANTYPTPEHRAKALSDARRKCMALKARISTADKMSTEIARDILNTL